MAFASDAFKGTIENLCTASRSDVQVSCIRYYSNNLLNVFEQLVGQVAFDGRGFNIESIESIIDCHWNADLTDYELLVGWEGFSSLHNTWEQLLHLNSEAPTFIEGCQSKMHLPYVRIRTQP